MEMIIDKKKKKEKSKICMRLNEEQKKRLGCFEQKK